ncbi:MAG: ribosome small subunit-dependent GTPase A [Clostridiaceae bacterium]
MQGLIVKGIGGFYYVKVEDGIVECKARGKFRHDDLIPMVGDKVEISATEGKGTIEKIYDRYNVLLRPAVANVTQALVVFSLRNPDINEDLLNKFLLLCDYSKLKSIVCFNKMDLSKDEKEEQAIINMVKDAGYEVLFLQAKTGIGIEQIKEKLKDNVTVLCGPSGVGKSTILNNLAGTELMEIGNISEKLKRGKHTTRHSELIELCDGYIVDTPGFSSLSSDFISKEDLQYCFHEFNDYLGECKFSSCVHHKEPGCNVKKAVENGKINKMRYDFYIKMLEEKLKERIYK